ncbi:MAG TPA: hypothetical protein VFS43_10470 [Polyangiaceae bacterium]|nr:hypothetical protein [Polyangiaceae bacterium]
MQPENAPRPVAPDGAVSTRAEREAGAGPLLAKVPDLLSLRFVFREAWPGGWAGSRGYVRHVSLEQAPALFELPCSNGLCHDGVYHLTSSVLDALSRRRPRFEGRGQCSGHRGTLGCTRTLRFVAVATYRPGPVVAGGARLSLLEGGGDAAVAPRLRGAFCSSTLRPARVRRATRPPTCQLIELSPARADLEG